MTISITHALMLVLFLLLVKLVPVVQFKTCSSFDSINTVVTIVIYGVIKRTFTR